MPQEKLSKAFQGHPQSLAEAVHVHRVSGRLVAGGSLSYSLVGSPWRSWQKCLLRSLLPNSRFGVCMPEFLIPGKEQLYIVQTYLMPIALRSMHRYT